MFRTEFQIPISENKISHQSKILTIGSCFSQVMGDRFIQNKFSTIVNPFGTIFNPISIVTLLESYLSNGQMLLNHSLESQGSWFNYHTHSELFGNTKEELNKKITEKLNQVNDFLLQVDTLIITLGTAFVYKIQSSNEVVANCHKMPATNFTKELLTKEEIVSSLSDFINQFKIQNSKFKIILTVSPVRHTKDTIPLNSLSKSILRVACHELSQKFLEVEYFPSFEIMMDDLRDYRFYKADMIHPTEVAEEYIWNKFSDTYFSSETKNINIEWAMLSKALHHKPFREDSEEYKKFLLDTFKKVELLNKKIDLKEELTLLKNRI